MMVIVAIAVLIGCLAIAAALLALGQAVLSAANILEGPLHLFFAAHCEQLVLDFTEMGMKVPNWLLDARAGNYAPEPEDEPPPAAKIFKLHTMPTEQDEEK